MQVKTVATVVTTDSAGRTVESIPVRASETPLQNELGQYVEPVAMVEDPNGTPIRIVAGNVATDSVGKPVSALLGKGTSQAVQQLTYASRFAALGDSITQYGTGLPTSLLQYNSRGLLELMSAQKGNFNIDVWGADASDNPGWFGANNGIAGQTLTGIGKRAPDVNTLLPDALIIGGGTNDNIGLPTFNQTTADAYTAMATAAHAAGVKHVFIRSILPKGPTASTGTTVAEQIAYNAKLAAFCTANSAWCHYVDVWTPMSNPDGTPKTGALIDDLHPYEYGTSLGIPNFVAAIEAVMDGTKDQSYLHDNFWASGNLLPNGNFSGSVAAGETGFSGNRPTGWTPSGLTLTTIVSSVVANPETGGQTWVMDITPPAGSGTETLTLTPAAYTPTANIWVKAWIEFEATQGRLPTFKALNGVTNADNPVLTAGVQVGDFLTVAPGRLKLQAPPLQVKASSTVATISINIDKGRAPFQMKFHRAYIGPMTDPHVTWGQTTLPVNTVPPSASAAGNTVGSIVTINPGTWTGVMAGDNTSTQTYQYDLYRDGVYVSSTYAPGPLAYTIVITDAGAVLTWKVGASNMAKGRSAKVQTSNSVTVTDATWKSIYDYAANTGVTNGVADANSTTALTCTRATVGYDYKFTQAFSANVPKRTADGLVFEGIATDQKSFPSLPDNAGNWLTTSATISVGGGALGPEGSIVSSRISMSSPSSNIRRVITSSANYRSAKAIVKGTAGQQVTLSYLPSTVTPANSVTWTFTGGWDVIDVPNVFAGNSTMTLQLTNVAGQATLTFDIVYAGVSIVGTGSATAELHTPFPTTTAVATAAADVLSLPIPAGAASLVLTYGDLAKQKVTVTPSTTYTFSTALRHLIRSIKII